MAKTLRVNIEESARKIWLVDMKNPKYRIKILAYPTGETEPIIDTKKTGVSHNELIPVAQGLLEKAIKNLAYEIIIDILEETEGAK